MYRYQKQFIEEKQNLFGDALTLKYPNWEKHLKKTYFNSQQRIRAWAHYIRLEEKLPTHNDNTNNYVESSFRETKDNQFDRTKCFNLPELLSTLLDHSEYYKMKLADLGNKRTANYKNNNMKSKYILKETNIRKEDINDIKGGNYIVMEERNGKEKYYRLNINSGFCECSKGKNCGPCDHKSAVAKHFKVSGFSVLPETDPHMRAMWHYIAFGKTLGNHWYRDLHDKKPIDIEAFISERLEEESDDSEGEREIFHEAEAEEFEDIEEEDTDKNCIENVVDKFKEKWRKYGEQVLLQLTVGSPNQNLVKAVKSANKILIKSLKSQSQTLANQLIWFGKDQHKKIVRGKVRGKINVQPTAVARSKANGTARRGRKMCSKGRPYKSKEGIFYMSDGTQVHPQKKLEKKTTRQKHCFKESLEKNNDKQ